MNWYLFAGYSFIIVVIFGYMASLHGKMRALNREVETLKEQMKEK